MGGVYGLLWIALHDHKKWHFVFEQDLAHDFQAAHVDDRVIGHN